MKNPLLVVSLVLLLSFVFGCQNKAEKAELEKFRTQAKVEEKNKAVVNRMWEAWNKEDIDTIKELMAPEFVRYIPSNSIDIRSPEERVAFIKAIHVAIPDVNFSVAELYADGDRVIYRFIMRGTHQGEWKGAPATGKKFEISGIGILRIENGKVVELREEPDRLGHMMQLGMELKPKDVEKK
jgi:steroid delta-isomerase-like uncharacterized protein